MPLRTKKTFFIGIRWNIQDCKLAGKEERHKISALYDFWTGSIHYGVTAFER